MVNQIRVYEKTRYPIIYSNTSWGHDIYNQKFDTAIANRNNFIEKFNIKRVIKSGYIPSYSEGFDHFEAYITHIGSYVYICSRYNLDWLSHGRSIKSNLAKYGFETYEEMYNPDATTFIKTSSEKLTGKYYRDLK